MKHLKKFEAFDLGRFPEDDDENNWMTDINKTEEFDDFDEECDDDQASEYDDDELEDDELEDDEQDEKTRVWGDEVVEKMNAGLRAYLDKKAGKSKGKADDKKDAKKGKAMDKKDDKKGCKACDDKKETKGLTAGQKKLPAAMQKAILAKKNKKK